jgi:hypothetical protein
VCYHSQLSERFSNYCFRKRKSSKVPKCFLRSMRCWPVSSWTSWYFGSLFHRENVREKRTYSCQRLLLSFLILGLSWSDFINWAGGKE